MKKGTVKFIKETSILLEMGTDFNANDLENFVNGSKVLSNEKLKEIIKKNFPDGFVSWSGSFNKNAHHILAKVQEFIYI